MNKPIINKEMMYAEFKLLGQDALGYNHYELADACGGVYSAEEWKVFLSEVDVQEYIKQEMNIIRNSSMNKIVQDAGTSNSVGKAQLVSALQRLDDSDESANGPIMIYCHVPPTAEQRFAPNFLQCDDKGQPLK